MRSMWVTIIASVLSRLDWEALLSAITAAQARRVGPKLISEVARHVEQVDRLPIGNVERLETVLALVRAPGSPVREAAETVPGHLLRWAAETAVTARRARQE